MAVVLIADDEPSLRLLARASLAGGGHIVLEAHDGHDAWRLLQEHRPHVAVLDVRMPGRGGLELVTAIRADAGLASTKVILLTGNAQQSDRDAGLRAGADAYVTKPFSPAALAEAVRRLLAIGC